jgi:hypothetical protein
MEEQIKESFAWLPKELQCSPGDLWLCKKWIRYKPPSSKIEGEIATRLYDYRRSQRELLWQNKLWHSWVFLHDPVERPSALSELADRVALPEYIRLISEVWNDMSVSFQGCGMLHNVGFVERLRSNADLREFAMQIHELELYANLPTQVDVYRAHDWYNFSEISWTLNREVAIRLAAARNYPRISHANIHKQQIVALFLRRGEQEIILDSPPLDDNGRSTPESD